jgi:antitoxin ParD1/3/4
MPRSFALGDRMERFIDKQVKSGRYNNASEVVRAGLRLLEDEERRRLSDADIRALIEEADRRDTRVPLKDVFARLEKRYAESPAARRKTK